MPSGGTLGIAAHNKRFAEGEDRENHLVGDYIAIELSDTGIGMEPAVLDRIFEPFFTTKESGKGSGLGLSQVYGFARQSGGAVGVRSAPGRGTTITLYLPRAKAPAAAWPSATELPACATGGSGKLLLVEDNRQVGETTEAMLEEIGYRVHRVEDPKTALAMLEKNREFELVFSDIVMPGGMSGADLAREIRRHFPAVRVVLTTGYSEAAAEIASEGFTVLPKPYRTSDLAGAIGGVLRAGECQRKHGMEPPS